jgi:hypothetical protein
MIKLEAISSDNSGHINTYNVLTYDTNVRIGEIQRLEDGFYYFEPSKGFGYYSSSDLKLISEELDILNKPWEYSLNNFYGNEDNYNSSLDVSDDDLPF